MEAKLALNLTPKQKIFRLHPVIENIVMLRSGIWQHKFIGTTIPKGLFAGKLYLTLQVASICSSWLNLQTFWKSDLPQYSNSKIWKAG